MKSKLLLYLTVSSILLLGGGIFSLISATSGRSYKLGPLQDSVYMTVDKAPVLKKQSGKLQKYLSKKINYPIDAFAKGIEGKVMVSFVVSKEGELLNPQLEEGLYQSLDAEALRVISTLTDWKPGMVNGLPVATKLVIPVHFYISDEDKKLSEQLRPLYANDTPPLFVLDNQKVTGLTTLDYYNVKSIRVIKGSKATELYGQDGKNGVLVIETKRGTEPTYKRY